MTITIEKLNHGFKISDDKGNTEKYWWMEKKDALLLFKKKYGYYGMRWVEIDDRSHEWIERMKRYNSEGK